MNTKIVICLFTLLSIISNGNSQDIIYQKLALAESFRAQLDYNRATEIYKEILEQQFVEEAYEGLSNIYYQQQMYEELLPLTEIALQNSKPNQKRVELLSLSGELNHKLGFQKKADSLWNYALDLYPLAMETYGMVAASQVRAGQFEKALNVYEFGNEKLEGNLFSDKILKLLVTNGDYKKAVPLILEDLVASRNLNTAIGRLYPFVGLGPKAEEYIGKELKDRHEGSDNLLFSDLYKWYLNTIDDMDAAIEVVRKLDELKNTDGREMNTFATQMIQDGKYDVAIKAYKELIDKGTGHKYYNSGLYGFANASQKKMETKKTFKAEDAQSILDIYEDIIELEQRDNITAISLLRSAELYLDVFSDEEKSKELLNDLDVKFAPTIENFEGQVLLSDILIREGKLYEARTLLTDMPKKFKRTARAEELADLVYKIALIELFSKNFNITGDLLSKAISNSSLDIANDAIELNQLLSSTKDTVILGNLSQGLFIEYKEDYNEAIEYYKKLISGNTTFDHTLMYKIAELSYDIEDYDTTIEYAEKIKDLDVLSAVAEKSLYLKAKAYYAMGDNEKSLDTYKRFMMDYPNSIHIQDVRETARQLRSQVN